MKKEDVYQKLAERMVLYADLMHIPVKDNSEPLVTIEEQTFLKTREVNPETKQVAPKVMYVRAGVYERLLEAAKALYAISDRYSLEVVYGHRSLAIQTQLFNHYKAEYSKQYSGLDLLEAVHRSIAVPEVAGHPAGAAVDVRILKDEKPINMGTAIWEFVPNSYTFSPFISKQAWNNRRLLRDVMKQAGFAPYDGEWWHFSYGDKEWAKYYNHPFAFYSQLEQGKQ